MLAEAVKVVVELLNYCIQPLGGRVAQAVIGCGAGIVKGADGTVGGSKRSGFQRRRKKGTVAGLEGTLVS